MRIFGFSHESFVDGPGIRIVIFTQGCNNACPHCHNPESWDVNGGQEYTVQDIIKMIKNAPPPQAQGLNDGKRTKLSKAGGMRPLAFPTKKSATKKAPRQSNVQGVTFSGGEPFMQAKELVQVATAAKRMGLDITTYTGYTYEELAAHPDEDIQALLNITDYLIDGPYIHEQRSFELKFRGSANQRIIDMNATREAGCVVEFGEMA